MARPVVTPEQFADMPFPTEGLDLLLGYGMQRIGTTPVGNNVRAYEPITGRGRGGSRPGLTKYVPSVIPADPTKSLLIQHLNVIVDPDALALLNTLGNGDGSGQPPSTLISFPQPTILDTSGPDEIGDRTNGDYWVPFGGWGVMPRRSAPHKQTITAYCVGIGLQVQGQGTAHSSNTTTGTAVLQLNGAIVATLNGSAIDTGSPFDQYYSATSWSSTFPQVPTQNTPRQPGQPIAVLYPLGTTAGGNGAPSRPSNWHFGLAVINQTAFNIGVPAGTGINTLSISGTWSVTNGNDVFNQVDWTGVVGTASVLTSHDGGNHWSLTGGSSAVIGIGQGNPQQSSGAVIPNFPATSLSTKFFL